MTVTDSASRSADLSAGVSADYAGHINLAEHALNPSVPTSADYIANSTTHAQARESFPNPRHGPALPALPVTDRDAQAARWRADEARRRAVIEGAASPAEAVQRLIDAGELPASCGNTILAVLR